MKSKRLESTTLVDVHGRALRSLRLSVTDRCNLRCAYCMPEEPRNWLRNNRRLEFEELNVLVEAFVRVGVRRVRLTGGEPLLRTDLCTLVAMLARHEKLEDLALTTNGMLLAQQADGLVAAGLRRVNVSLDTLDPNRFRELTQRDGLERVLEGIARARAVGLVPLKLDTVVIRGRNDDEIVPLLSFARSIGAELRFIEYMDVPPALHWKRESVVTREEILARIRSEFGRVHGIRERGSAPAERFELDDGTTFGVISSVSTPFCGDCDRVRLTADGTLFTCLYDREALDLRTPLRAGATAAELAELIRTCWRARTNRGAEEARSTTRSAVRPLADEQGAEWNWRMRSLGG